MIVERLFSQIEPGDADQLSLRPLSTFFDKQIVVVLGDPGLGKTTAFEAATHQEKNAEYLRIGIFLETSIEHLKNKILYLDGIDEYRSSSHGENVIERIAGRLEELECPKVRLSCRMIDWHGAIDVEILQRVSKGEQVYVTELKPLSDENIKEIARSHLKQEEKVTGFLRGIRRHDLDDLLRNPLDLDLYLTVYQATGKWPDTLLELLEIACRELLKEKNIRHGRTSAGRMSLQRIRNAAEDLCALALLSGKSGFSVAPPSQDKNYPAITSLTDIDSEAMIVAAGRRAFSQPTPERCTPKHRRISEFLAAHAFARRIKNNDLPLGRALN